MTSQTPEEADDEYLRTARTALTHFVKNELRSTTETVRRSSPQLSADYPSRGGFSIQHHLPLQDHVPTHSSQLEHLYSFQSKGQKRPGTKHGRGGRRKQPSILIENNYSTIMHSIICKKLSTFFNSVEKLVEAMFNLPTEEVYQIDTSEIMNSVKTLMQTKPHFRMEAIPGDVLGVSAYLYGASAPKSYISRYESQVPAHCTWLDDNGIVKCTCKGEIAFRPMHCHDNLNEESLEEEAGTSCSHVDELCAFLTRFSNEDTISLFCSWEEFVQKILEVIPSNGNRDTIHNMHNQKILLCRLFDSHDTSENIWVPVRYMPTTTYKYNCTFCHVSPSNCRHAKYAKDLHDRCLLRGNDDSSRRMKTRSIPRPEPLSILPLPIASCPSSIKSDDEAGKCAKIGKYIFVSAPSLCPYCQSARDEASRRVEKDCILMSTYGPGPLYVETYHCSNPQCHKLIATEGSSYHICLITPTTAITHNLMRQECEGVALSCGTFTARLQQYVKRVMNKAKCDLLPLTTPCRSVKTLGELCRHGMKLMMLQPPPRLFSCQTCEYEDPPSLPGALPAIRMSALCIDGIQLGSQARYFKGFQNYTSLCFPIPKNIRTLGRSRPPHAIFRKENVPTILFQIIRGNKVSLSTHNVTSACSVLRLFDGTILPSSFLHEDICNPTSGDSHPDLGPNCILRSLRGLLACFFHIPSSVKRITRALINFFTGSKKKYSSEFSNPIIISTLNASLQRIPPETRSGCVAWNEGTMKLSAEKRRDILTCLEAILVDPVTNMFPLRHLHFLDDVLESMGRGDVSEVRKILQEKSIPSHGNTSHVLCENLLLSSFLSAVAELGVIHSQDETVTPFLNTYGCFFSPADKATRLQLLMITRQVLQHSVTIVKEFYSTYLRYSLEPTPRRFSAADYAMEWGSFPKDALLKKFEKWKQNQQLSLGFNLNRSSSQPEGSSSTIPSHSTVCTNNGIIPPCPPLASPQKNSSEVFETGFFFPAHPQIRPLPFGPQNGNVSMENGSCTKNLEQRQIDFSHGAVTFCCSCSFPIIYGFKILEASEGSRGILDVCISRFPDLADYIIYDFACGLYRSAIHTLWWAFEDTILTSDAFHSKNHKCSKMFHPRSYNTLKGKNTVSHEQRNRPIREIQKTLRRCQQDSYIAMLGYQTTLLNLHAVYRQQTSGTCDEYHGRTELVDKWYFEKKLSRCIGCERQQEFKL